MKALSVNSIKSIIKPIEKSIQKNAPQILSGLGIAFGVGAVGLSVKATVKAVEIVKEKQQEKGEELTKKEIIEATWKNYIPVASCSIASAACIVASTHISMRRLATMTAAYAMSENSFKEYKEKAVELLGEKKEEEIRGKVSKDYIDKHPPYNAIVENAKGGATLCLDKLGGRYFYSDADTIRRTVNDLNHMLNMDYHVALNDFYYLMDMKESGIGDTFGWCLTDGDLINVEFDTELTPEGTPVLVMNFTTGPRPNFRNLHI